MALLILRFTLGITAIIQGAACLYDYGHLPFSILIIALFAVAGGAFLLVGLMTPLAAFVVFLISVGTATSIIPSVNYYPLLTSLSAIYVIVISAAVILLGPGAISLDARMFGRREITIPAKSNPPKS